MHTYNCNIKDKLFSVVSNILHLDWGRQNTTNVDFIYFFIVYLWILLPSISLSFCLIFWKIYIFLFSYSEQKELSFTFLNKMWTEAQICPFDSLLFFHSKSFTVAWRTDHFWLHSITTTEQDFTATTNHCWWIENRKNLLLRALNIHTDKMHFINFLEDYK